MKLKLVLIAAIVGLFPVVAFAQQPQGVDPRVAQEAVQALNAQISYLQAVLRAEQQDKAALAQWWADYVKPAASETSSK